MRRTLLLAIALLACAGSAPAQNLFEVQVFPDEVLAPGETTVELHNVVLPSHLHLSVEVTRGWTDAFETGVFIETSPSESDQHAALAGFHFRPKYRFGSWTRVPFHASLSLEYAFMKQPGDTSFRQALAITPILERHVRGMEVSFNPAIEVGLRGPQAGEAPVFEPSAKVASQLASNVWLGVEYYAETGSIKHFEPLADQHHLIFPALDIRTATGWDLNVGVGRGLTGGSEHWVVKWIVGLRLPR